MISPTINFIQVKTNLNSILKTLDTSVPYLFTFCFLLLLWSSKIFLIGFYYFELFTVFFQDWASWGIFTVILGNPRRTKGDSQHLEARPELQHWLRSELFKKLQDRAFFEIIW